MAILCRAFSPSMQACSRAVRLVHMHMHVLACRSACAEDLSSLSRLLLPSVLRSFVAGPDAAGSRTATAADLYRMAQMVYRSPDAPAMRYRRTACMHVAAAAVWSWPLLHQGRAPPFRP